MADRNPDGTYAKGHAPSSGAGRPFILAKYIASQTNGGQELVDALISVARGEGQIVPRTVRVDGTIREVEDNPDLPQLLFPDLKQRAEARDQLLTRLFGKPLEKIELATDGAPLFARKELLNGGLDAYAALVASIVGTAQRSENAGEGAALDRGGVLPAELPQVH